MFLFNMNGKVYKEKPPRPKISLTYEADFSWAIAMEKKKKRETKKIKTEDWNSNLILPKN